MLQSHVLAIDETSIKASNKKKGKLHQGYYIPVYGDQDEMVFNYSPSKSRQHIEAVLSGYQGVILSDGNSAYEEYAKKMDEVVHAQCWSHSRRYLERAHDQEPIESKQALDMIAKLYSADNKIEDDWRAEKKIEHRANHCQPIVADFLAGVISNGSVWIYYPTIRWQRHWLMAVIGSNH